MSRPPSKLQDAKKASEVHYHHMQVNRLMDTLKLPFEEQAGCEAYTVPAPRETRVGVELLSCSS